MSKFRFLKSVIYKLKRRYGASVTFVRTTDQGTTDYTTGVVSDRFTESKPVRNVIFLPFAMTRNFSYDLSYIAANKNFTYGGQYDADASTVICEKKDLGDFALDLNVRMTRGTTTYNIKKVQESYEDNTVLIISVVELKGDR